MRLSSLGSGSKGNGTLVASADTLLLVDCGFRRRDAELRLAERGVSAGDIDAILVTHEHSDHASGVAALSRAHGIPVYLTHGTAASGRIAGADRLCCFNADDPFAIGDIGVQSVSVPHDAREPVQFRLQHGNHCVGVITDLGSITSHVVGAFRDCSALVLEFNHDLERLRQGPYPMSLKRRVGGDFGHLNNEQALSLLDAIATPRLREVIVAHISEQNNSEALVASTLAQWQGGASIRYASQSEGFDWVSLSPEPGQADSAVLSA